MAKPITYKPNFRDTGRLLRSAGMQHMCVAAANNGAAYARSISPVVSGEYQGAFIVVAVAVAGPHNDRAGAQLINTSGHAAAVEWRLGHRVLGRTADYIEKTGP